MPVPTLTAASPSAGYIAWSSFTIQYMGTAYPISAGNSNLKYIWWLYNAGAGGALQGSNTLPTTLTDDDILLFINKSGLPFNVSNTGVTDGSLIVQGSILADSIGANQILATHISSHTITANEIAADTITATEIAALTITASEMAADSIIASKIATGAITAGKILAGNVDTTALGAFAVTAAKIQAGTITANEISAGSITASRIATGHLSDSLVTNPNFEDWASGLPTNWLVNHAAGPTVAQLTSGQLSGTSSVTLTPTSTISAVLYSSDTIPCKEGDKFYYAPLVKRTAGAATTGAYIGNYWYTAAGTFITSDVSSPIILDGTIQRFDYSATAPATAAQFRPFIEAYMHGGSTYTVAFDDFDVRRFVVGTAISDDAISTRTINTDAITTKHMGTDSVTAKAIKTGEIKADKLETTLALTTKIASSLSGSRWEADVNGIRLYNGAEVSPSINLPTDTTAAYFAGDIAASGITCTGTLAMQSATNELSKSSTLTLNYGTTKPAIAPSVQATWPYITAANLSGTTNIVGLVRASSKWWTTRNGSSGIYLRAFNDDGTIYSSTLLLSSNYQSYGLTYLTTAGTPYWYLMVLDTNAFTYGYWVFKYTAVGVFVSKWQYTADSSSPWAPTIGNDGTDLLFARYNSSDTLVFRRYTIAGTVVGSAINTGEALTAGQYGVLNSVLYGVYDFGDATNRYVTSGMSTTNKVYTAAGVRTTNESFPTANAAYSAGLWYEAGSDNKFFSIADDRKLSTYSTIKWTTESSAWWVSYSWRDSNATGGTHETDQGPRAKITMSRRASLSVTAPSIPSGGGTDDPNSISIYLARGSTDPNLTDSTNTWLQLAAADGVVSNTLSSAVWTGVAHPGAGTAFAGVAGGGSIKSGAVRTGDAAPVTQIYGDGTGRIDFIWRPGDIKTSARTWDSVLDAGWLLCDGTAVSRTTYADLFAVISTNYGIGNGTTTFNLPDARSRNLIGIGTYASVAAGLTDTVATEASRSPLHTHSTSALVNANEGSHTHAKGSYALSTTNDMAAGGTSRGSNPVTGTSAGGSNHTHAISGNVDATTRNSVPFIGFNFFIKF